MAEQIGIDLNLDTTSYIASAAAASQATDGLHTRMAQMAVGAAGVSRALSAMTPGRVMAASFAGFATAAAQTEQSLSTLAATSAVTGVNAGRLSNGMRQLAREFPVGARQAQATVETINRLGVAGVGTEKKVISLAKSFTRLAGATGESPDVLAAGMTQLSRSFGSIDTKRIDSMNDSLVTLKANSGASATSILDFSKAIAPMAKQAGIGQAATMGIATSFSKLGEDGFVAANAVNKMLSDLNRSAREGSSEMGTYAAMVGKTREEFADLYKTNPAEALIQINEAIAKGGNAAPRMLESIGIEGVRGSRAILNQVQSGGMRGEIERAVDAQGNGMTERGAEAAFGGLNDSLTRLSTTAQQAAEAFGQPLLGPLTAFTDKLQTIVDLPRAAAETGVGQKAISGLAYGALGLMALKTVFGPLSALATGQRIATSGPVQSLVGGATTGRAGGDYGRAATATRAGRFASETIRARQEGTLNRGMLGRANERIFTMSQAFGNTRMLNEAYRMNNLRNQLGPDGFRDYQRIQAQNAQRSGFSRWAGRVLTPLSMGMEAWSRVSTNEMANARIRNPGLREDTLTARGDIARLRNRIFGERMGYNADGTERPRAPGAWQNRQGTGVRGMTDFGRTAMRQVGDFGRGLDNTRPVITSFGRAIGAAGRVATQTALYGASLGTRGLGGIFRGIGLGGMGLGLGVMGAMYGVSKFQQRGEQERERREGFKDTELFSDLNRYRSAMGRATESSLTLGQTFENTRKIMTSSVDTLGEALKVSAADVEVANQTRNKRVTEYAGSAEAVASRINAMNPMGLQPQDLQDVKVDLLRQRSQPEVSTIMDLVGTYQASLPAATGDTRTPQGGVSGITAQVKAMSDLAGERSGMGSLGGGRGSTTSWMNGPLIGYKPWDDKLAPGGDWDWNTPGKKEESSQEALVTGIANRRNVQADNTSALAADETMYRSIDEAMREAAKNGDQALFADLSQRFSTQLTGKASNITIDQMKAANGESFVQALSGQDQVMFDRFLPFVQQGGKVTGESRGVANAQDQLNTLGRKMMGVNEKGEADPTLSNAGVLGGFFDNRTANWGVGEAPPEITDPVARADWRKKALEATPQGAMQASLMAPEDTAKFTTAVETAVDGALGAGQGLESLATAALTKANELDNAADPAVQRLMAINAEAERASTALAPEKQYGASLDNRLNLITGRTSLDPNRPEMKEEYDKGRQQAIDLRGELRDNLAQNLMMRRQAEIASKRAEADYTRQRGYAKDDYGVQRERAILSYNTAVERAEDANIRQREQATDEFNRSIERMEDDNKRNRLRSDEDFGRERLRQQEDFDLQLARQIEDAAKSMYDPYQRIQTQGVWDTQSLMMNMQEQNAAIERQSQNLGKARNMGLSSSVIDLLGLGKTENAQQLAKMIDDMMTDPALVAQLNKTAGQRGKVTGGLFTDEANTDLRRQREDYDKGRSRSQEDYKRGQDRQAEDFDRNLKRQRSDFARSMRIAAKEFEISMSNMNKDHRRALREASEDHNKAMNRMRDQYNTTVSRTKEDIENASKTMSASLEALQQASLDLMGGKMVDWDKLMTDGFDDTVSKLSSKEFVDKLNNSLGAAFTITPTWNLTDPGQGGPTGTEGTGGYIAPLAGNPQMTQEFGRPDPRYATGYHTGVDFGAAEGTAVMAALSGLVKQARYVGSYGNTVLLDHGEGRETRYAHLSSLGVNEGMKVSGGQLIGRVGNTGNSRGAHLHWEAKLNGQFQDPLKVVPTWQSMVDRDRASNNSPQAAKEYALRQLPRHGWGRDQWDDLLGLWNGESNWNYRAANPTSSARGIPQAMMSAHFGPNWRSGSNDAAKQYLENADTQVDWGLKYIRDRYSSPERAFKWWNSREPHWYAAGGLFNTGPQVIGVGERGPEAVIPLNENGVRVLAESFARYVNADEAREIVTGGNRTPITYVSESHHYDQRNDFTSAQITVQAQDPDEMARKLEAKQRRSNLVGGRR